MAEVGKTLNPDGPEGGGVEIDPVTGQPTTGHVWDGIRELNRPLPRWWLWTFYATIIFHWSGSSTPPCLSCAAAPGVLGYSTRADIMTRSTLPARRRRGGSTKSRICRWRRSRRTPISTLRAPAALRLPGQPHPVPCTAGSKGYANLNDDDWLWGGTLDDIYSTIAYGVRSDHPDTRYSEMIPFTDVLTRDQIVAVANYVLSLSNQPHDAALATEGKAIYDDPANCVSCHGEGGVGDRTLGAPRLDAIALAGRHADEIVAQVENPAWRHAGVVRPSERHRDQGARSTSTARRRRRRHSDDGRA
jgi:cytochrome c oxidase cbb3-type subunit 3